ncbi:MAG: hypothetical protein KBD01_11910 [Acidobacteria bacterium]|nr:hypothetical protein [Acidobacteriota bacterium]
MVQGGWIWASNHAYIRQLSSGGEGGGIWLLVAAAPEETLQIVGNTFSGNTASSVYAGEQGGAMAVLPASAAATIANNLMAFNSSGIYQRSGFSFNPTLVRNGMYNGSYDYVGLPAGPSDIVDDPLFVDRPNGDYRLQPSSPMIDVGSPEYAPLSTDLDGAPRVQDADYDGSTVVDIGAYEFSPDFDHDGTADWRDTDDDADGVGDPSDCAPLNPAAWTTTVEVAGVGVTGAGPTVVSWTGQDADVVYDVASGALTALLTDGGFGSASCVLGGGGGSAWSDERPAPPAGDGAYYLVRARNACGDGGCGPGRSLTVCP